MKKILILFCAIMLCVTTLSACIDSTPDTGNHTTALCEADLTTEQIADYKALTGVKIMPLEFATMAANLAPNQTSDVIDVYESGELPDVADPENPDLIAKAIHSCRWRGALDEFDNWVMCQRCCFVVCTGVPPLRVCAEKCSTDWNSCTANRFH